MKPAIFHAGVGYPRSNSSLALGFRSTQPKLFEEPGVRLGQGPKRSTLLRLRPTSTESLSNDHTPGALPSLPPDETRVTSSRLVARREFCSTYHTGLSQNPRSRLRKETRPSK